MDIAATLRALQVAVTSRLRVGQIAPTRVNPPAEAMGEMLRWLPYAGCGRPKLLSGELKLAYTAAKQAGMVLKQLRKCQPQAISERPSRADLVLPSTKL